MPAAAFSSQEAVLADLEAVFRELKGLPTLSSGAVLWNLYSILHPLKKTGAVRKAKHALSKKPSSGIIDRSEEDVRQLVETILTRTDDVSPVLAALRTARRVVDSKMSRAAQEDMLLINCAEEVGEETSRRKASAAGSYAPRR